MSAAPESDSREWYEASPDRLQWELAEFAARGLPASAAADADSRMVIPTELPLAGEPAVIEVVFPYAYPDIRAASGGRGRFAGGGDRSDVQRAVGRVLAV